MKSLICKCMYIKTKFLQQLLPVTLKISEENKSIKMTWKQKQNVLWKLVHTNFKVLSFILENVTIFFKPIEKSYTSLLLSVSHPENPLWCSNYSTVGYW